MQKPSPKHNSSHSEQQCRGLRTHANSQKQHTVDRLTAAIVSLEQRHQPISARAIYEECGLEYTSIVRNPQAHRLFQEHSTFLKEKGKRKKASQPFDSRSRDPRPIQEKPQNVSRLDELEKQLKAAAAEAAILLEKLVEKDITIAELQAKIAKYEEYLGRLRLLIQKQEHQE